MTRKNAVTILQSRRAPGLKLWTEGTTAKRMAPGYTAAEGEQFTGHYAKIKDIPVIRPTGIHRVVKMIR